MTVPSLRRLRSTAVALALTAAATGTAVAVAGPAHATGASCSTTSTLTINGKTAPNNGTITEVVKYGASITVSSTVSLGTCSGGVAPTTVDAGTLAIERSAGIDGPWTVVTSVDVSTGMTTVAAAGISGKAFLPGQMLFRAHFTGATSPEPAGDTFTDSYAFGWGVPVRVTTLVSKHCTTTGCTDTRRIAPAASIAGLHVTMKRWVDGVLTTVGVRKVSSTGLFTFTFRRGTTLVAIPQARGYAGSFLKVTVTR
ncbi:hypothetical protein GCM10028801_37720 [Nocardioides maradonensis]